MVFDQAFPLYYRKTLTILKFVLSEETHCCELFFLESRNWLVALLLCTVLAFSG